MMATGTMAVEQYLPVVFNSPSPPLQTRSEDLLVSDAVLKAPPAPAPVTAAAAPPPAKPSPEETEAAPAEDTEETGGAPADRADSPSEPAAEASPVGSPLVQQVVEGATEGTASLGLVEESTEALRAPDDGKGVGGGALPGVGRVCGSVLPATVRSVCVSWRGWC